MNTRKICLIAVAVVITLLCSCEPVATEQYGFDIQAVPGSAGVNSVEVSLTVTALRLTGNISVSEGTLSAEVMTPSGAIAFTAVIMAPGELHIDRYLPPEPGCWRMRYLSVRGTGYIRMQMHLIR